MRAPTAGSGGGHDPRDRYAGVLDSRIPVAVTQTIFSALFADICVFLCNNIKIGPRTPRQGPLFEGDPRCYCFGVGGGLPGGHGRSEVGGVLSGVRRLRLRLNFGAGGGLLNFFLSNGWVASLDLPFLGLYI